MLRASFPVRFSGWVLLFAWFSAGLAQAQKKKEIDIQLYGTRPQVVRGQSAEWRAYGKTFALESVEISPPEGLSVREIKPTECPPYTLFAGCAGVKFWTILIAAEASAQPGERSLVLVTQQGRSKPQRILVATHAPRIADLQLRRAQAPVDKVEVTFSTYDEAGDLPFKSGSILVYGLLCGNSYTVARLDVKEVVKKDAKNWVIHASLVPTYGVSGKCKFTIEIADEADYKSNELETSVQFD
ncbi:MAG: hypothetical protein ACRD2L_10435 [Terriglobia bacterium]